MPDETQPLMRLRETGIEAERANVGNLLTFIGLLGGLSIAALLDISKDTWINKDVFERTPGMYSVRAMEISDTVIPLLAVSGLMSVYGAFFAVVAARAYGVVLGNIDLLRSPDQIPTELSVLAQDTVRTLTRATWYNAIARWSSYGVLVLSLICVYVTAAGDIGDESALHTATRIVLLILLVVAPVAVMGWVTWRTVRSSKRVQELVIGDRKLSWHQNVVDNWIDELVFAEGDHQWHKTNRISRADAEARAADGGVSTATETTKTGE